MAIVLWEIAGGNISLRPPTIAIGIPFNKAPRPMVHTSIHAALLAQLESLPLASQQAVLDFAKSLSPTIPPGVSGEKLAAFAGCIPADDCNLIAAAIEDACERVDPHE